MYFFNMTTDEAQVNPDSVTSITVVVIIFARVPLILIYEFKKLFVNSVIVKYVDRELSHLKYKMGNYEFFGRIDSPYLNIQRM